MFNWTSWDFAWVLVAALLAGFGWAIGSRIAGKIL